VDVEPHERLKLFLLTVAFFFVIAAYTIAKELKDSIFVAIVGQLYLPAAKLWTMVALVPAILLYAKLVDKMRRYHLLAFYSSAYALLGLVFAYFLGHPTIGIPNTDTNPYRIFGWVVYFFVEGYSPFVVSVFWAFANSINDPESAKKNYGLMVSGSKLGGMLSAGLAWMILANIGPFKTLAVTDTSKHQLLLGISSALLAVVPFVIFYLQRTVSGRYLHGYEAAYKVEKQRSKEGESSTGVLAGFKMLVKYPYVFGIFCIILFYEMIHTVLSFQRVTIARQGAESVAQVSSFLFKIVFVTHFIGFFISLIGTRYLLKRFGEKLCLMFVPVSTVLAFLYFKISGTQIAFLGFYVAIRSINYAFSYPVRESLYIPTVKEIKFKSKSWIDAFGTKFAKFSGMFFNYITYGWSPGAFAQAQTGFFSLVMGVWFVAAYMLGLRFERAIFNNEVIGSDPEPQAKTS